MTNLKHLLDVFRLWWTAVLFTVHSVCQQYFLILATLSKIYSTNQMFGQTFPFPWMRMFVKTFDGYCKYQPSIITVHHSAAFIYYVLCSLCACLYIFFHSPASWGPLAVGHAELGGCCGSSRSVEGRTIPPHSGRWGRSSLNHQHRRRHSKGPMSSVHASTGGFTESKYVHFHFCTENDNNTHKKQKPAGQKGLPEGF